MMKFKSSLFITALVVIEQIGANSPTRNPPEGTGPYEQTTSLYQAYGPVSEVPKLLSWLQRNNDDPTTYPPEYFEHRQAGRCDFPIEVVFLRDQNEPAGYLNAPFFGRLHELVALLNATHPGSRVGVGKFSDIGVYPHGQPYDHCFTNEVTFTANPTEPHDPSMSEITEHAGADPKSSAFSSMLAVFNLSDWSALSSRVTRIMVLLTATAPHFDRDGANVLNLPPYSADAPVCSSSNYYPSPYVVRDAARAANIYSGFVVVSGKNHHDTQDEWMWFNSLIDQPQGMTHAVLSPFLKAVDAVRGIFHEVELAECGVLDSHGALTLEQVNGPAPEVSTLTNWRERDAEADTYPAEFFEHRSPSRCDFPLDIVTLVETPLDYSDYPSLKWTDFLKKHPGSRTAVVQFNDISAAPMGDPKRSYCQRVVYPLGGTDRALQYGYFENDDARSCAFTSIAWSTASNDTVGWDLPVTTSTSARKLRTRVVITITSSAPHFAGDNSTEPEHGLSPFVLGAANECGKTDYPSAEQVRQSLEERQAYLSVMLRTANYKEGVDRDQEWAWMNRWINQPAVMMNNVKDFSSTTEAFKTLLRTIEEAECIYTGDEATHPPTTEPHTSGPEATGPTEECCNYMEVEVQHKPKHLKLEINNED